MARIYTRGGDKGYTSLLGGRRVSKASLRVDAYGSIDELNSAIGLCISFIDEEDVRAVLEGIQGDLFIAGAELADPSMDKATPRIGKEMIRRLEEVIDRYEEEVGSISYFILPGGSREASLLHLARAIARRAERVIVALRDEGEGEDSGNVSDDLIAYMNRLSSLLFVLARVMNRRKGIGDVPWKSPRV
ncbi:MAG: cob(I)yrinic acid a,c-diamide adenosyltransferase [Candidatus Nitrosocaldus sp.]|nr:cob(I)yrinic acid a,c-diamide adenosyltransferase [Candidatus Nitrosocaldus sp.]MDW8000604.1 cob(I)yrinic acid a,c-diamide adenosyltransferase [Candidatus Nitrosocaldus sp.]